MKAMISSVVGACPTMVMLLRAEHILEVVRLFQNILWRKISLRTRSEWIVRSLAEREALLFLEGEMEE